jgi:predicted dehydrogenase
VRAEAGDAWHGSVSCGAGPVRWKGAAVFLRAVGAALERIAWWNWPHQQLHLGLQDFRRMTAEESHSGSHSPVYGIWSEQGGGSLIGKGCHPLGGVLYLKRKEGLARNGKPIRPVAVSCRTHSITKQPAFEDRGYLRTTYKDTEDYAFLHVIFDDGMIADVMTSELVLGGVYDFIEVYANNHRTRCHIQPVKVVDLYSPDKKEFANMDLMEKISSNEGWIQAYPEFGWSNGQFYEMHDFVHSMREGRQPECDLELAIDITLAIYAGYVSADRKGAEVAVPSI